MFQPLISNTVKSAYKEPAYGSDIHSLIFTKELVH